MSKKRFEVLFYGDVINCVKDENGKEYNLHETIDILMDQQDTINKQQGDINRLKYIIEELRKDNYKKFEKIKELSKE